MDDVVVEQAEDLDEEILSALPALLAQLSSSAVFNADHLAAVVAHPATTFLVARSGGEVVGTTTLVTYPIPTGWRAHVDDVVVSAESRGRGVGEALVRAAVQQALDRGVRSIELTSRPSRESAIRLYERLGFTRRETGVYRYDAARFAERSHVRRGGPRAPARHDALETGGQRWLTGAARATSLWRPRMR